MFKTIALPSSNDLVKAYAVTRYSDDSDYTVIKGYETLYAVSYAGNIYKADERLYSDHFDTDQRWVQVEGMPTEADYIGNYRLPRGF